VGFCVSPIRIKSNRTESNIEPYRIESNRIESMHCIAMHCIAWYLHYYALHCSIGCAFHTGKHGSEARHGHSFGRLSGRTEWIYDTRAAKEISSYD
jgi:hypothetical protein